MQWRGGGHWGSSQELLKAIYRVKPKVHLFGHIHEQRGHWNKVPWGRETWRLAVVETYGDGNGWKMMEIGVFFGDMLQLEGCKVWRVMSANIVSIKSGSGQ